RRANTPLNITLHDGKVIHSTHVGNLDQQGLGNATSLVNVVPGLVHSSLLSIKQMCNNGCHDRKVFHNTEIMLVGRHHPATRLWIVPTNTQHIATKPPSPFVKHTANNTYQTSLKSKLIQFLHQCIFSRTPSMWIKAINNNQFSSWPGLTVNAVLKYLPKSTATAKGHMKKTPAGVQSTRPKPQTIRIPTPLNVTIPPNARIKLIPANNDNDLFPKQENNSVNHIFCWAALADQINGTTYTDLTGCFPTMSLENKQHIFVAYNYTTNAIIV
ncbi:hypothetical protein ACHAW6_015776, partial [Cyclotella cf. meneghiniana]